jgi:hypothetical protein
MDRYSTYSCMLPGTYRRTLAAICVMPPPSESVSKMLRRTARNESNPLH